ncbi:MAG TPA: glycosyltransferase [Tepidisphaeraceae bacterium]|nr:glycosyltransferase [Tepidisphaeraceae bacterium]
MSRKLSVVHIINSFQFGGAERMLCNLLLNTDMDRFEPSVVSLIDDMTVAAPIIDAGIPITVVGMRPGIPDPRGIARLARHLWRLKPAVIQTWMDHSNLIGGIAARLVSRTPLVWGIHHSNHIPSLTKKSTLATVWACKMFSRRVPTRIVCCSEHARGMYAQRGFADDKLMVIPNGFDVSAFRPDPAARANLRRELDVHPQTPLVGLIARYDPFKDHETFLRAAAKLKRIRPDVHYVLCGHNVDSNNSVLMAMIGSLGIGEQCHLIGARTDVPRVLAGLDLAAQSSVSEAFPLVLGEAMACGVPCVATDVGDSRLIVGDTGKIVPARDPDALAAGMGEMLAMRSSALQQLGITARTRVREMFDLKSVTRRYESLYTDLASAAGRAAPIEMQSREIVATS